MYLTTENAAQYLDKKLDCHKRMWHFYPLTVKQFPDGEYFLMDWAGVARPVPEVEDPFRKVWFDFVVDET